MKVAIIGCGVMGTLHAEMAQAAGCTIAVCGDVLPARAQALAKMYQADASSECRQAIAREDIDVVVVATPTPSHAEYVTAAVEAGKAVFCEKPFARTPAEAKRVAQAAEGAGAKVFVGHVVRYFHEFEALERHVRSGRIGDVGFAKTYRGGYCPEGEGKWYQDYEQSGGAAFDLLIHDYDWLAGLFGPVQTVFCRNLLRTEPVPMDYAQVTLTLESGTIAQITGSWAHPAGFRVKAELCGTGGMLQFDSEPAPVSVQSRATDASAYPAVVPVSPVADSPYLKAWREFAAWVQGGPEPRVTLDDAVRAVDVAAAALQSASDSRVVNL